MSIVEIAKLAGVSHTTVARVVNNKGNVSPETASKIRKIMEQIGYKPKPPHLRPGPRPSSYKRGIKTGHVAFLASSRGIRISSESPLMLDIMHTISDELINHGLSMVQGVLDRKRPLVPVVAKGDVDGLLVFIDLSYVDAGSREFLRRFPIVFLMTGDNDVPGDRVCPDNRAIGQIAAEYLIKKGCKDILYFGPAKREFSSAWAGRWEMFRSVAEQSGIRAREVVIDTGEHDSEIGTARVRKEFEKFVTEYFKQQSAPDGLFIAYDLLATVLYPILQSHGIKIGQDLQIVSCNNETSLLAGLEPKPARIDLQPKLIGKYAVEQLLARIQNPDDQRHVTVQVQPILIE